MDVQYVTVAVAIRYSSVHGPFVETVLGALLPAEYVSMLATEVSDKGRVLAVVVAV